MFNKIPRGMTMVRAVSLNTSLLILSVVISFAIRSASLKTPATASSCTTVSKENSTRIPFHMRRPGVLCSYRDTSPLRTTHGSTIAVLDNACVHLSEISRVNSSTAICMKSSNLNISMFGAGVTIMETLDFITTFRTLSVCMS
jgi:hypothetical protein